MIPYVGCKVYQNCKNSIAAGILSKIPKAENFYDLFGGGGSVTEAAAKTMELFHIPKWKNLYYNDLNFNVYNLFRSIIFDWKNFVMEVENLYLNPITNAEFDRIKFKTQTRQETPIETLIMLCYTFGNKYRDSFIWSYEEEIKKIPIIKNLSNAIKINKVPFNQFKKYRINFLKHLHGGNNIEYISPLQSLERLVYFEPLRKRKQELQITNLDYHAVPIMKNSVLYCDIPYSVSHIHYNSKFNHADFYKWASEVKIPVFFSDYSLPFEIENKFILIWNKNVRINITKKDGKAIYKTEKLYWNGVKLS